MRSSSWSATSAPMRVSSPTDLRASWTKWPKGAEMSETNINVSNLLDGQIVLVTGAGQGNGRAIAQGVARSGARVVVTDVQIDMAESTAQQIRSHGGEASALHLDVTDAKE